VTDYRKGVRKVDEYNISVEEVMKITHKGREWILNAIEMRLKN